MLAVKIDVHPQSAIVSQGMISYSYFYLIAIIYFFFNSALLPHGLLFTTILAPVFYIWLLLEKERWVVIKFLFVAIPFATFSLIWNSKADYFLFLRSVLLFFLIYLTVYAATIAIKKNFRHHILFRRLIKLNFVFCIVAIGLRWTPYVDLLWSTSVLTQGIDESARLKLFTYEPSYYSMLMVPLVAYSITGFLYDIGGKRFRNLLYVLFPLALSFSFGVISGLVIAIGIASVIKLHELRFVHIVGVIMIVVAAAVFLLLSPDSVVAIRLTNVISGTDTSGEVRTVQSNLVAWQIMDATSLFWGAGFGQAKLLAVGFFDEYWLGLDVNRLTNAVAGTAAEFGICGVILRFIAEFWLFFRTKVYDSYFRLTLFLFAFIYQFTGSFVTNVAEYIIWIYAFVPVFLEMDRVSLKGGWKAGPTPVSEKMGES